MVGSTREGARSVILKREAVKTIKVVGKSSLFVSCVCFRFVCPSKSPERASPSVTNRLVRSQSAKNGQAKGQIFYNKGAKV